MSPDAPAWRRASIHFVLLVMALTCLFADAALSMASIWINSSVYHHGLFVAPISVWLILQRKDWREAEPAADALGAIAIVGAGLLWLLGSAASIALLGHVAFVVSIAGAVTAIFGRALALRWAFPIGFLFFMVPFGEEATPLLQAAASAAVAAMLDFSGVETTRDGFMLTTAAGRFEMAQSCAGLRFLMASAMISSLVAWLAFAGWRKRLAFIGAALAAAIVANWLRAYLIVLVATATDRKFGVGPEHVALGWAFYSLLIIGLIILARRMADHNSEAKVEPVLHAGAARSPAAIMMTALLGCALIVLYDDLVVSSRPDLNAPRQIPALLADGFRVTGQATDWQASADDADARSIASYASADAVVLTTATFFTQDRAGAEIAGANLRSADGVVWRRIAVAALPIETDGRSAAVSIETLQDPSGRQIDVATLYWLGDTTYRSAAAVKFAIAAAKLTGQRTPGGAIFVAAPHAENADPRAAIQSFFANFEGVAAWRERIGAHP